MSAEKINQIPMLFGEKDPIRSLQFLPGVQAANEATSGLNVRGGGADQNQFILDDATIYNVNHLFGFFSVFNPEAVKEVTFYRADFPARYGGKISSVADVTLLDGNKKKLNGSFSVSPLAAKFEIDGPVAKGKGSWLIAARRTYMDYYSNLILNDFAEYDRYHFYDLNAKFNYAIGVKTHFYLSIYNGKDVFASKINASDNNLHWGNTGISMRVNQILSDKMFLNTTLVYSSYNFESKLEDGSANTNTLIKYQSTIKSITAKTDLDYFISNSYHLKTGLGIDFLKLKPGILTQANNISSESEKTYQPVNPYLYCENILSITPKLNLNLGLRLSAFQSDTTYFNAEPRLTINYAFDSINSINFNCAYTTQPLHQLTNSTLGLPTELWVPAIKNFDVENSWSYTISYHRSNFLHYFNYSVAAYYRTLNNITDYKPGATFLTLSEEPSKSNYPKWEENVTSGKGIAYGAEFFFEKPLGQFTGWVSYTLAWSKRQFDLINNGNPYYASYDRRNNLSIVLNYELKRPTGKEKITLSGNWVFASANPITLPYGFTYPPPGTTHNPTHAAPGVTLYSDINAVRLKNFHRLDLSIKFENKTRKQNTRTWEIGVYNVYNRLNPFIYYIDEESINYVYTASLKQKSYFPVMPYVTYTLKF